MTRTSCDELNSNNAALKQKKDAALPGRLARFISVARRRRPIRRRQTSRKDRERIVNDAAQLRPARFKSSIISPQLRAVPFRSLLLLLRSLSSRRSGWETH